MATIHVSENVRRCCAQLWVLVPGGFDDEGSCSWAVSLCYIQGIDDKYLVVELHTGHQTDQGRYSYPSDISEDYQYIALGLRVLASFGCLEQWYDRWLAYFHQGLLAADKVSTQQVWQAEVFDDQRDGADGTSVFEAAHGSSFGAACAIAHDLHHDVYASLREA